MQSLSIDVDVNKVCTLTVLPSAPNSHGAAICRLLA